MESLFEFFFKYRPLLYERGEITLATSWPVWAVVGGGALLALAAVLTYLPPRGDAGRMDRGILGGLRLLALAVVVICLLQPALVLSSTVPQRNFVAVLLDDSRSMRIADEDGSSRRAFATSAFGSPEADLRSALAERFSLRFFRFGETAGRIEDPASLTYGDRDTRMGPGIEVVRQELDGVPLSGVVVVSDGAGAGGDALQEILLQTRAAGVPVYTVGVGAERIAPDVEVSRVEMPRRVLRGTSMAVDVVLEHRGFGERTVPLRVEEEGVRVAEEMVTLPAGDEPTVVRLHLDADAPGPRLFRFAVPPREGETVTPNNARDVLVSVVEDRQKILYFEGHPRFEVKFLRRAVEEDELMQLVVLQRTAENKFLRLSVDDGDELAGGFPTSREELFQYRALILGSVGAGFFTPDQLRMIREFVDQRGGSLLMLGGEDAFAEGDYIGTPVADVLPVVLDESRPIGGESFFTELRIRPTPAGRGHAALQLAPDTAGAEREWASLPALSSLNPVRRVKPGATTLLTGSAPGVDDELVVLAWQRYGRGKALALTVHDTWMWQMHADMPVDDLTHETLWRQLMRWMLDGVPERMEVSVSGESADPGRPAGFSVELSDSAFLGINDARVTALVTGPAGEESRVELAWDGEEDGTYSGTFEPGEEGLYRIDVEAERPGGATERASRWLHAAPSEREFFGAGRGTGLLRRVAEETGGRYYPAADASTLPEDLQYTGSGVTVVEERDLWDMPALLFLLVLLVGIEWTYRRARGLA